MKKSNKELLFERMHTVGGMPLKEFADVITKSRFPEFVKFIDNTSGYYIFFHTTNTVEKAKKICTNGFQFQVFDKTTDYVSHIEDIDYLISMRKAYGNFIVVIQIRNT